MSTNIILETKFVADISGSFYIPSYQRGYRWSETEVGCVYLYAFASLLIIQLLKCIRMKLRKRGER